jgi:hypothetical protein
MDRIYYYVLPHGAGWRVQTDGASWDYPDKAHAMARAVSYARHQWDLCHLPSGVRVQRANGQWMDARAFGTETRQSGTA